MSNHPLPHPLSASGSLKQNEMFLFGSRPPPQTPDTHNCMVGCSTPPLLPQAPVQPPDQAVNKSIYMNPNLPAAASSVAAPAANASALPNNADQDLRATIAKLRNELETAKIRLTKAEAAQEPGSERDRKIIEECTRTIEERNKAILERDALLQERDVLILGRDAEIYRITSKIKNDKKELRKKHQQAILNVNREKVKSMNALRGRYDKEINEAKASSQESKKAFVRLSKVEAELAEAKQEILDLCAAKAATEKELHDCKDRVQALAAFERGYSQVHEEHTELQAKYNDLQAENTELVEKIRVAQEAVANRTSLVHYTQGLSLDGPHDTRGSDQKAHIDILEAHWKNVLDTQMANINKKQAEIALYEAKIANLQQLQAVHC